MPRDRRAVIGTGIWSEPSIRQLTRRQQQAYQLALTQPDLNRCGVLAYRPRPWAGLSADGTEADLRDDFQALHDTRHVILDDADELLLIRTYVRHDGLLSQPLVVAAMVRDYFTITSPLIKTGFLAELRRLFDLPDIEPKDRVGLALAIGADPAEHQVKNGTQVSKAIGLGLAGPLIDRIAQGHIEPFTAKGLPKGLTEGLQEGLTKGPPDPMPDPQGQGQSRIPVTVPVPIPIPVTVPATSNTPPEDPTSALLLEHVKTYATPPPPSAISSVRLAITKLVAQHTDPDHIRAGLRRMREKQLGPALLPDLVAETIPTTDRRASKSTTDDRVAQAQAVANRYRDNPPREITA